VQKRNREKKECEEKENKRKEVRDQHIKGFGSQIFKSKSRSTMKRSWNETWKYYRRL
jgi:hypothetical protein